MPLLNFSLKKPFGNNKGHCARACSICDGAQLVGIRHISLGRKIMSNPNRAERDEKLIAGERAALINVRFSAHAEQHNRNRAQSACHFMHDGHFISHKQPQSEQIYDRMCQNIIPCMNIMAIPYTSFKILDKEDNGGMICSLCGVMVCCW